MWIYLNNAFVSVVAHAGDHEGLLVRARREHDIERALGLGLGHEQVQHTPDADYPYRLHGNREEIGQIIGAALAAIDYTNYKNSIEDEQLHGTAYRVYSATLGLQSRHTGAGYHQLPGDLFGYEGCKHCGDACMAGADLCDHCLDTEAFKADLEQARLIADRPL